MNQTKDIKQQQAYKAWVKNNYKGLIAGCTGFGKSKLGTWAAKHVARDPTPEEVEVWGNKWGKVLLIVPTEELRDKDWVDEFTKWDMKDVLEKCVTAICYASLDKVDCRDYQVVIFDEFHHMTKRLYEKCMIEQAAAGGTRVLMLSATPPKGKKEATKKMIMDKLGGIVYSIGLDEGAELGLVSDYRITVIEIPLDDQDKYIEAGKKGAKFMTTEAKTHEHLMKTLTKMRITVDMGINLETREPLDDAEQAAAAKALFFFELKYNNFIYNLKSKETVGKQILAKMKEKGRTLVFAGSIAQCENLCGEVVYHSKLKESKKEGLRRDKWLQMFRNKEIGYLGAVDALNEGVNIPEVQYELILQCDSNPRKLSQRVGRGVRFAVGHVGKIFILVAKDTADENWTNKALAPFDKDKITRITWGKKS